MAAIADTRSRLESLDILRGLDMFFILLPDPIPCIVVTFCAMFGWERSAFALQFDHVAWEGLHLYDCIFPLFLFVSGVTFPFSYARQVEKGWSRARSIRKIAVRGLLLFALGSMLWTVIDGTLEKNVLSLEWEHFRVWSVIGRIGIAWAVAAAMYVLLSRRARILATAVILVGMWAVVRLAVAPGAPAGTDPLVSPEFMFVNWLDVNYLTTAHRPEGGAVTVTMVATAMFGMFAGEILRAARLTQGGKVLRLLALAAALLAVGLVMAFGLGRWSLPVIKAVWTSSFVLVAGGISAAALALIYWIVDIRGWRRWGFVFKVIGMNAIAVYILMRTVFNGPFFLEYFFGGLYKVFPLAVADFLSQAGLMVLVWAFLYVLYRKKLFLKV